MNKAYACDNYPTLFIDQIIDDYDGSGNFSFMDGFLYDYKQIKIKLEYQHKTTFSFPWWTFTYIKMCFGLKTDVVTFQQAMSYAFHEINNIVKSYLNDLSTHSKIGPNTLPI